MACVGNCIPLGQVDNRQANFNLVTGAEEIAGQNGASRALYNQYNGITNFQPRIGLAWSPGGGKTVLRAGYTLSNYLEGTGTNLRLPINPPFAIEHDDPYKARISRFQAQLSIRVSCLSAPVRVTNSTM